MKCKYSDEDLFRLVNHQIGNFWLDEGVHESGYSSFEVAVKKAENNFLSQKGSAFQNNGEALFDVTHTVQYSIFLYYYAHQLFQDGNEEAASKVYYLNKIMNSVDWFYAINLPEHFGAEHPLGSVIGRATIGDYLFLYQGTSIGGNRKRGVLYYPLIGNYVLMYSNSKILGNAHIGNNVILSANTYVIDEDVPDNCIVFGSSPNLVIKDKSEMEIQNRMSHIWK